ncbi:hypothetical protein [Cetobacterium sp.]|uniref:hypothetical protein n=1 Tax=Cetobacterium sp. TaxID=2071632 RepID=UPI003F3773A8
MKKILLFLLLSVSLFAIEKPYYIVKEIDYDWEEAIICFMVEDEVPKFELYDEIYERACYALQYGQAKYPDKKKITLAYTDKDGKTAEFRLYIIVEKYYFDTTGLTFKEIANGMLLRGDFVSDIKFDRIIYNIGQFRTFPENN